MTVLLAVVVGTVIGLWLGMRADRIAAAWVIRGRR
jgi:hypothetical protein